VPGKKRLSSGLVGGLPRPDLHRINITAREKGIIVLLASTSGIGDGRRHSRSGMTGHFSRGGLVKICTRRFRGNVADVILGTVVIWADALFAEEGTRLAA
jgi:hypothetical protein